MPGVCRISDMNNAGGRLMTCATTVFIENRPMILHPSWLTNHPPHKGHHTVSWTLMGTPTVYCEGHQLVTIGAATTCGHIVITGSPTVFAEL